MSSFEQAAAAIEGLWAEELADFRARKQEVEDRVQAARAEIERLQGAAQEVETEAAALRAELSSLPSRLMTASLKADKKAEKEIRTRYSELQREIEALENRAAASRAELRERYGDAPEQYVEQLRSEGYPLIDEGPKLFKRIREEHARLGALLDGRLAALTGGSAASRQGAPTPGAPPVSLRLGHPQPQSAAGAADPRTVRLGR